MRFFHSFWSGPVVDNKFQSDRVHQLVVNIYSYALSVAYIHKFGYQIDLYADPLAAKWLSAIPYDNVYDINIPEGSDANYAAQGKFWAYKQAALGDCYIDGDVFLMSEKLFPLLEQDYDATVQCIESGLLSIGPAYEATRKVMAHVPFKNNCSANRSNAYNTGLVRLVNPELKQLYIDNYFLSQKLCTEYEADVRIKDGVWADLLLEQQFLYQMSKGRFNVRPLLGIQDNWQSNSPYQLRAISLKYMHMGGSYKYRNLDRIKQMLYEINPQLKNAIDKFVAKEINLRFSV